LDVLSPPSGLAGNVALGCPVPVDVDALAAAAAAAEETGTGALPRAEPAALGVWRVSRHSPACSWPPGLVAVAEVSVEAVAAAAAGLATRRSSTVGQ
jgi:hypothetical protein